MERAARASEGSGKKEGHLVLFDINDLTQTAPNHKATRCPTDGVALYCTAEVRADLQRCLPDLSQPIHIASEGAFSMHQLALHILSLTGPAHLYATTWAINEEVVSTLVRVKQNGLLLSATFLFDWRVRKYKPSAYALATQHFSTQVVSLHAKVCVIENERHSIAIVGSANWTRNSKIEAFCISTSPELATFWKSFINERVHRSGIKTD